MTITKTKFLNRFTAQEKAAILAAGDSSMSMRVYLFDLNNADEVDITHAEVIAGVQAMEAAGLLASGRSVQILSPVQDHHHHLVLVSGTTFKCDSTCGQTVTFSAFGQGEPSVDENGNPPSNPEQWIGPCDAPN